MRARQQAVQPAKKVELAKPVPAKPTPVADKKNGKRKGPLPLFVAQVRCRTVPACCRVVLWRLLAL